MGTSCMAVSREHLTLPKQLGLGGLHQHVRCCLRGDDRAGGDGDQGAAGGDGVHIVQGSALCALEETKPELGVC